MNARKRISEEHPLKTAWNAYRETDGAKTSERWAKTFVTKPIDGGIMIAHPHTKGALWEAFMAGFVAGGGEL